MDQKDNMEHYIMLMLKRFVSTHVGPNLSCVDDIIVEYMVSILEGVGMNCNEFESSFEVEEFVEMMTAYIPGFDQIDNILVTEWVFSLAAKIRSGKWSEDSIAMEREEERGDQNNNVKDFQNAPSKSDDWFSAPSVSSSVLFPEPGTEAEDMFSQFGLEENELFPSAEVDSTTTNNSADEDDLSDIPALIECDPTKCDSNQKGLHPTPEENMEEMFPAFQKGRVKQKKSKEKISYLPGEEGDPLKTKYSEKVDYLLDMFPDVPECQLRRCLSKTNSNVEKAVAIILSNRNDGTKNTTKQKEKENRRAAEDDNPIDEAAEQDIRRLMEMFPRLSECRVRDRYYVVGNDSEKAMRVILSEEESRSKGYQGNKFQIHEVSFKKKELSEDDENALKREISKKYSYYVDDPEKEHHPAILVKKGSTKKVSDLCENDYVNNNSVSCVSTEGKVEIKQSSNPKLNRKTRFR